MARGDVQIINPCTKWFRWEGSKGILSYFDKDKKESIEVQTPFTFLVLETYTTIKGYDETAKDGIYANEVKDTTKQILKVKCGKETIVEGLYKDIKEKVVARGGGYCQSVYIAFKDDSGQLAIGNIMMAGSSFGGGVHKPADKNMKDIEIAGWLKFSKDNALHIMSKAVTLEGRDERVCTNGATKFYAPKFKIVDTSPETDKQAEYLAQNVLLPYMNEYFKKTQSAETEAEVAARVEEAIKKEFGGTTQEMTADEKLFMVKPEIAESNDLPEMGELPNDNIFNGRTHDLPF